MTPNQWCAMLAKLVAPMEPARAAKALADMLPLLVEAVPVAAFTARTVERVAAGLGRVPTYGELKDGLLAAHEAETLRQRFANRPALPPPESRKPAMPGPRDPPTEAEIRLVGSIVAAFKAERRFHTAGPLPAANAARAPARHLSDERLLADYERVAADPSQPEGSRAAAATRAAMLRRKLGMPTPANDARPAEAAP